MTMCIDWTDVEEMAKEAAGNHRKFESFGWYAEPEDSENWAIVYTNNRDSGLIDQSNAAAIDKAMEPHTEGDDPDAVSERHNHWACGWVDGYAIRVYRDGQVTDAFRTWCDLHAALAEYPVLDDWDHDEREHDAACKAIGQRGGRHVKDDAPEGWEKQVFSWMWENDQRQLDNNDGTGAYPSEESVKAALDALDLLDCCYFVKVGEHRVLETLSKDVAFKQARMLAYHRSLGLSYVDSDVSVEQDVDGESTQVDEDVWDDEE